MPGGHICGQAPCQPRFQTFFRQSEQSELREEEDDDDEDEEAEDPRFRLFFFFRFLSPCSTPPALPKASQPPKGP